MTESHNIPVTVSSVEMISENNLFIVKFKDLIDYYNVTEEFYHSTMNVLEKYCNENDIEFRENNIASNLMDFLKNIDFCLTCLDEENPEYFVMGLYDYSDTLVKIIKYLQTSITHFDRNELVKIDGMME
jgi:hypothetical protein